MKSLIEQFTEAALSGKGEFTFSSGSDSLHMVSIKRGEARLIYGDYSYALDSGKDNLTLYLVAIVKGDQVYLRDATLFSIYKEEDKKRLPKNVMMLRDYQNQWVKKQKQLVTDHLKLFLRTNTEDIVLSERQLAFCKKKARQHQLRGTYPELSDNSPLDEDFVTRQKCIDHLSGFIDLEKEMMEVLQGYHDTIQKVVGVYQITRKLIDDGYGVYPWELNLLKNLTGKMKTVKVLFEYNGKTAEGSVDTKHLKEDLLQKDFLSAFTFASTSEGKRVLASLGVTNTFGLQSQDGLCCKDIVQVTYQKKVLYKRAEN